MEGNKGGHECEFVEKPPKAFQSDCPVCLLVLQEPFQVTCCRYAFCRLCIERIKKDNKPCPCCNFEDFDKFEDKRLKRSLYEFKMYCINKQQGCKWEGELRELDNHLLNSNPGQQKQLDGCQFMQINCLHCAEVFLRSDIQFHQETACLKRPFSCEYCNEFDSTHEDVTINHWSLCGCFPVLCSNECGETIERQNLESHVADHCPETIIDCDFEYAGCDVKLPRRDMPTHIKERAVEHLSLHAKNYKAVVDKLKEENKQLKLVINQLNRDLRLQQICTPVCPADFTINDFEQHKIDNNKWYFPFYTHPKGYKMCLTVTANSFGECEGTHTAVGIRLMKGEFDDQLKWPLRGNFIVWLLSQVDDDCIETYLSYTGSEDDYDIMANPVLTEDGEEEEAKEIADGGPTCVNFISHTELQQKYLKNNCLRLCAYRFEPL